MTSKKILEIAERLNKQMASLNSVHEEFMDAVEEALDIEFPETKELPIDTTKRLARLVKKVEKSVVASRRRSRGSAGSPPPPSSVSP